MNIFSEKIPIVKQEAIKDFILQNFDAMVNPKQYAFWEIKNKDFVATFYNSGKFVIQGKNIGSLLNGLSTEFNDFKKVSSEELVVSSDFVASQRNLTNQSSDNSTQKTPNSSLLTPNYKNLPKIEILTPDFKGNTKSLDIIIQAAPDVFNHNIEVVERIFKTARPQGDYKRSLEVLRYVKENSNITTKSGLMVGLGETFEDIENTLNDLKNAGCDIVTIGQYITPSKSHFPLDRFYTLEEFEQLKTLAKKVGIKNYQVGPLVRSSYNAAEITKSSV